MSSVPIVAIIKGERGHKPVFEALDLIDHKKALAGLDKVVIKVNFIVNKTWDTGATTDPIVVEAIILKLKDVPVKQIYVAESDNSMTNADEAFKATGMNEMCTRNGVECLNLRYIKDRVKLDIPDGETLKNITIPRLVTESAIISAAKLKTNTATKVTLGMKNMFGLLPDKAKIKYHARGISDVVVDINTVLKPKLTVIDGFVGMEGKGPGNGKPVRMDLIIAGDVVATVATASRVMGFDPSNIKHMRKANEKGLGSINAKIIGQQIDAVARKFEEAKARDFFTSV